MSTRIMSAALVTAALAVGASSASAAILSQNFEGDTPGGAPSGTLYTSGHIEVVDSSTNPVDPFAASGNHSLLVEDNSDPNSANAVFSASGASTTGTFSFDFWSTKDGTWTTPYFEVRIGNSTVQNGSDLGVWFAFNNSGNIVNYGGQGTLDQTLTHNASHTIVINYDTSTDKWSGTLDNVPLTAGSGSITQFDFYTALASVQSFGFSAGYSTTTTVRGFVDNLLVVVPEPTTLSLLAVSAGLGLLRPRRRRI
ncbi:MAG: PEP-CTERM sorting domain-containing protein [Phycisphaerales bacterium]|nr:PEP-CTERM sorting domain-containing protein [Phycisphaerales bacterium]